MVLRLAWRAIWRRKRRSIITSIAIGFGLAMMLIFVGIADDSHARMAEMGIRMGSGHVVVQGKGYLDDPTLDHLVKDPLAVIDAVKKIPGVRHIAPRVQTTGLISAGELSSNIMVNGVDPQVEILASDLPAERKRRKGKYLRTRAQMKYANLPADIYLGGDLAKTLNIDVGDRVVVTVSPKGKSRPASAAFVVRGIFGCGVNALDAFYAEVPIKELQALLSLGNAVTQVAVLLENTDETAAVAAQLKSALHANQGLEILPWQEALRELYEALVLDDNSMYMMMAIIFVIIALGIFNSVMMSVVERTREFGVMMALGTWGRSLLQLILVESLLLGIVASFFGLLVGLLLHYWVASVGIDIGSMTGGDYEFAGVLMEGRIYSRLSLAIVTKWTLVVIVIVVLSAFYPAWRASRLRPVEAMRHV